MNSQSRLKITDRINLYVTALLLLVAMAISLTDSNQRLFIELNHLFSVLPGTLLQHLTSLADVSVVISLLLIVMAVRPMLAWQILLAGIATGLIVQAMKMGIAHPRPAATLPIDTFNLQGPALASSFSFPSGHSATIAIFLAPVIFTLHKRSLQILLLMIMLFIASARIAVGAHWPLDVIAGVFIGWWICLLLYSPIANLRWTTSRHAQAFGMTGVSILVIYGGFFHHTGYHTEMMQAVIASTALIYSWSSFTRTKKQTRHP